MKHLSEVNVSRLRLPLRALRLVFNQKMTLVKCLFCPSSQRVLAARFKSYPSQYGVSTFIHKDFWLMTRGGNPDLAISCSWPEMRGSHRVVYAIGGIWNLFWSTHNDFCPIACDRHGQSNGLGWHVCLLGKLHFAHLFSFTEISLRII